MLIAVALVNCQCLAQPVTPSNHRVETKDLNRQYRAPAGSVGEQAVVRVPNGSAFPVSADAGRFLRLQGNAPRDNRYVRYVTAPDDPRWFGFFIFEPIAACIVVSFFLLFRLIDACRGWQRRPQTVKIVGNEQESLHPLRVYDYPASSPTGYSRSSDKSTNYIARHWQGELSLVTSFWVNGFLGNVVAVLVVAAIYASTDLKDDFHPGIALASAILMWGALFAIMLWQIVGVWRSATHYRTANAGHYWGGIAKLIIVLAVGRSIVDFGQTGIPRVGELYKIYAGDEEVGRYAFRLLRGGEVLEFSGGITFGAAKEFQRFLDGTEGVKVVSLDSLGGRIFEAQRIGDLIKGRGLSTYAGDRCLSACTIIFLSGRERILGAGGRLGFHQPDFPGLTSEERRAVIADEERRLRQLGVSEAFARQANVAAPANMWFPTTAQLLAEHVITRMGDP